MRVCVCARAHMYIVCNAFHLVRGFFIFDIEIMNKTIIHLAIDDLEKGKRQMLLQS